LLRCRCINANPNYGILWFYCRKFTDQCPPNILKHAQKIIIFELKQYCNLYCQAVLFYVLRCLKEVPLAQEYSGILDEDIRSFSEGSDTRSFKGQLSCVSDFTTGIVAVNQIMFSLHQHKNLEMKRNFIFGIDQIIT
jgi:hypothetical protein